MTDRLIARAEPPYRTAQERVVAALRRAILSGELEPGTRVTQNDLAERLAASTSPVREAVRELASEGLLKIAPNTSVTVAVPTLAEVADVYELLLLLEPLAMSKAARRISPAELKEAEEIQTGMALIDEDSGQWSMLNCEFHDRLDRTSGSEALARTLRSLRRIGALYVSASLRVPNRLVESLKEHDQLLGALRSGDGPAAGELARQHLLSTLDSLGIPTAD
jgi:DNA-binding GntR family transcriptional regulator